LEQVVLGTPDRTLLNLIGQGLGDVVELALEPADVLLDALVEGPWGEAEPVFLRHQHFEQLAPSGEQGIEQLGSLVGQRPRRGAHPLGKQGQDRRIELIGLGELAGGAGEIPDLARIGDHHRQAGGSEPGDRGPLEAPGRFTHEQGGVQGTQAVHEGRHARLIVRHAPLLPARAQRDIEGALGYVEADEHGGRGHDVSSLGRARRDPTLRDAGSRPRSTVRVLDERRWTTPRLTDGLGDPRRLGLSPTST